MREMLSNLRGFRSESGILIWNCVSSSPTISGSAKESKNPESNRDSSAAGTEFFFETFLSIAMIVSLLSIRSLGANREKPIVLLHQLVHQHVGNQPIAPPCKVHVVALAQASLHPLANGSRTAHARPPIPKCAAVF